MYVHVLDNEGTFANAFVWALNDFPLCLCPCTARHLLHRYRCMQVQDGRPPFEDVALLLSECGVPGALQLFLSTRLACLSRADKAQVGGHAVGGRWRLPCAAQAVAQAHHRLGCEQNAGVCHCLCSDKYRQ